MQIIFNVNILLYALLTKRLYICHWLIWSASTPKPIRKQDCLILTTRGVIAIIFGRFFESSEKGPKGGFFSLDKLENNNSERKGKEKKKERGGREEETKKKQWLHS